MGACFCITAPYHDNNKQSNIRRMSQDQPQHNTTNVPTNPQTQDPPVTASDNTTHRKEMESTGSSLGEKNSPIVVWNEFFSFPNRGMTLLECCGPSRNSTL